MSAPKPGTLTYKALRRMGAEAPARNPMAAALANGNIRITTMRCWGETNSQQPKKLPFGGVVFAYEQREDELTHAAVSICSLNDNFDANTGRIQAVRRLWRKDPEFYFTFPTCGGKEFYDALRMNALRIATDKATSGGFTSEEAWIEWFVQSVLTPWDSLDAKQLLDYYNELRG